MTCYKWLTFTVCKKGAIVEDQCIDLCRGQNPSCDGTRFWLVSRASCQLDLILSTKSSVLRDRPRKFFNQQT